MIRYINDLISLRISTRFKFKLFILIILELFDFFIKLLEIFKVTRTLL